MSPEDVRLVAELVLLQDRLNAIIEEIMAGVFVDEERQALATVLATIAAELNPGLIVSGETAKGGVDEVDPVSG